MTLATTRVTASESAPRRDDAAARATGLPDGWAAPEAAERAGVLPTDVALRAVDALSLRRLCELADTLAGQETARLSETGRLSAWGG